MRIRPLLFLVPSVMAGTLLMASPPVAVAANGMTETGTVTYEVVPAKNQIHVTVQISIANHKANEPTTGGYTYYFWDYTQIYVEEEAGTITATSDAGGVSQSTISESGAYRLIKLSYPNVYYGETRVVTATYDLPGAPGAKGGFRAGQAFASLCAIGNGEDTGTVSVVIPDGYDVDVASGDTLARISDSGGKQVFSSGVQSRPRSFQSCIEARNPASVTHSAFTSAGQAFDLQGWPDDPAWGTSIRGQITVDMQGLEDLTGLKMPGGTIAVAEIGSGQLNDQGLTFQASPLTVGIPESVPSNLVAHALSHVWFNKSLFKDVWVSEGLAGYAEKAAGAGLYTPCGQPGGYPGAGSPDLGNWMVLNNTSPTLATDENVATWQRNAACYFFTTLADAMGPADFKAVVMAAAAGEMAYVGATPGEKMVGAELPVTAERMLDLLDERGMVAAGLTDLDRAQKLLANYGVLTEDDLAARSAARATYHSLATSAGKWKMPLAIRGPMSNWDFDAARTAMATAGEIVDVRDAIEQQLAGFSLDGTDIQKRFESAATQEDLDSLLSLIKQESGAAASVDRATKLDNGGRSILQTIGLIGTDVETPLEQARADLQGVEPEQAGNEAQSVIDRLNGSSDQGLLRVALVVGTLLILLVVVLLIVFIRRRRRAVASVGPGLGRPYGMYPQPFIDPATGAPAWPSMPPAPAWQPPAASAPVAPPPPAPTAGREADVGQGSEPPRQPE